MPNIPHRIGDGAAPIGQDDATAKAWIGALEPSHICFFIAAMLSQFFQMPYQSAQAVLCRHQTGSLSFGYLGAQHFEMHFARGQLFENMIVSELFKQNYEQEWEPELYFWRERNSHEIDLLAECNGAFTIAEIKSAATINTSFFDNLLFFQKHAPAGGPVHHRLIYGSRDAQIRSAATVIPWNMLEGIFFSYLCLMQKLNAFRLLLLCLALWSFPGCRATAQNAALPYHLDKPDRRLELVSELLEISGLEWHSASKHLMAVQDELGIIYRLDPETGSILQRTDFATDGDFEGIAVMSDTVYAVKSTGTVYRIVQLSGTTEVLKFKSHIDKTYDVEGLTAHLQRRQLLMACKAASPLMPPGEKHIYAWNLDDMSLPEQPALVLRANDMLDYLQNNPAILRQDKMLEYLSRADPPGSLRFSPSGIAVHPSLGHWYVLSGPGRMLAVYSPKGQLLALHRFDKDILAQPEGICFDPWGNLYITSEGEEFPAVLCVWKMR